MPLGRRRPIMRAAALGTVAYQGSKRGAMAGQEQAYAQQAPPADYAPPPPPPPPPAAAPEDPTIEKISQLAQLHANGALTDEEFAAAKAKALGLG